MSYYVYMIVSKNKNKLFSYVGYTKNLKNRLNLHNISQEAKYTRCNKWIVFQKEIYNSKSKAMSREYELKKDRKIRDILREKFKKNGKKYILYKNRLQ